MPAMNPGTKKANRNARAETAEPAPSGSPDPLDQGRLARKNGDLLGALNHFKAARREKRNGMIAQFEIAQTLDLLERPAKALDCYKKILERFPDNVRASVGASLMTFKLGDRETAVKSMESVIAAAKKDPKKLLYVAEGFITLSEPGRASELLRSVVQTADDDTRARVIRRLANLASESADSPSVLDVLDSAVAESPDDPRIRYGLAQAICVAQPDWTPRGRSPEHTVRSESEIAKARAILEDMSTQQKGEWNTKALVLLAHIARYEHRWDDALLAFEKAAAAEPGNLEILCEIGICLCDLSRLDEAKLQFDLVLSKDAAKIEALLGLGDVAKLQDDLEGALREYERAAVLEPNNATVHARLRRLQGRVGKFDWREELDSAIHVIRDSGRAKGTLVPAAVVALRYGVTDVLQPVTRELEDTSPAGRQIVMAARALDRAGLCRTREQLEEGAAGGGDLDEMAGVVSKIVPGAETLLVIFGGAAGQVDITFSLFYRLLRARISSMLFVRDVEDTRYLGGIVGLGSDFDSTVDALRGIAERSGAKRLLMIGNCQGAGAAIRYGVAANAEAILAFDPRIGLPNMASLKPVEASKFSQAVARFGDIRSVDEIYSNAPDKPRLFVIYDSNREPQATRARELGRIEGATAAGIPVVRSQLLRILLAEGLLTPILSEFVASGRIGEKLLGQLGSFSKK